jgi:hypothetical protein
MVMLFLDQIEQVLEKRQMYEVSMYKEFYESRLSESYV